MSKMQEMFDMEIPEWMEGSEEARGSKNAVVGVIIFFVLFIVGNVIPTILQMVSLVSFIIKEMDLSSLNPISSITIEGTTGTGEGNSAYPSYDVESYSAYGTNAESMAKLEAFLEWLDADIESSGEIDNWEDNAEEEILNQINQGSLSISNDGKEELSLFEGESMKEIMQSYIDSVYEKTMKLMSKLPASFYLVALYSTIFATLTFLLWGHFAEKRCYRSLGFSSENFLSKYFKGLGVGL